MPLPSSSTCCKRCLLPTAMDPLILEPGLFLVVLLKLALNHGVITTTSGLLLRGCQSEPCLLKPHTTRSSARQHRDSSLPFPTIFVPPLKPLEIEITESLWPASSPRHAHRRSQTKPDLQLWSLAHHRRALGRLCFSTVLSRKFFRRIYIHLLLHRRDSPVTDAEIPLRSRPTYYSVQASPSSSSNRNHWSQAFSADGR
ncbi:LOW QUALITY PROTEIN: hypothetical protein Bca4012_037712 [Brassica carinata]